MKMRDFGLRRGAHSSIPWICHCIGSAAATNPILHEHFERALKYPLYKETSWSVIVESLLRDLARMFSEQTAGERQICLLLADSEFQAIMLEPFMQKKPSKNNNT